MNLKILYLGSKSKVSQYLSSIGDVDVVESKLSIETIIKYDWIVSYGYRHILSDNLIKASKNPIINLHISYLPWNRGASPNYFSWKDSTTKGVTIHQIDKGIDTGDIYIQKQINFSGEETLSESYNILKIEIEKLFISNFENIINNRILPYKQSGNGTINFVKDIPEGIDWNKKVKDI